MDAATQCGLAAIAAAAETTAVPVVTAAPPAKEPAKENAAPPASAAAAGGAAKQDERARIAAIVGAPEAKGREGLAQHLAFHTELAAPEAIAMLKAAPLAAAERTSRLEGKVPVPKVDAVEHDSPGTDRAAGLRAAVARQLAKIHKQPLSAA